MEIKIYNICRQIDYICCDIEVDGCFKLFKFQATKQAGGKWVIQPFGYPLYEILPAHRQRIVNEIVKRTDPYCPPNHL